MLCFVGLYEESKYIPHIQGHNQESCPGQEESLAADSYLGKKTEKSEVILEPTVTQESHLNPSIALLPWSQRLRLVTKTGENIFKQALEPLSCFSNFLPSYTPLYNIPSVSAGLLSLSLQRLPHFLVHHTIFLPWEWDV